MTTLTIVVANGAHQGTGEAQADPNMTAPMGLNVGFNGLGLFVYSNPSGTLLFPRGGSYGLKVSWNATGWDSFEWPNATAEMGDGFSFNPEGQKTVELGSYQDNQGNWWFLVPVQDD